MPAGRRFLHSWPPGQLWAEGTARRYDANGKSVYAFTVSEKPLESSSALDKTLRTRTHVTRHVGQCIVHSVSVSSISL